MAVSKRKDRAGRHIGYQVTVQVPDPRTGKKRRVVVATYRRRKEADAAERSAKIKIDAGTFSLDPPAQPLTVGDAVAAWFAAKRQNVTSNTAAGYETALRLHVLPAFGGLPVTELTQGAVQAQVDRWQQAGMGATLVNRCLLILRGAMARQVRAGVISPNPVSDIEKVGKRRRRFAVWDDAQLARFLAAAEVDRWAPVWFLATVEGMRRGEICGLMWSDLEWSADGTSAIAHIRRSLVPDLANGGKAMFQDRAKTRSGERAVQLTSATIATLRAHRDRQRFERERLGHGWAAGDLVMTTSAGTPLHPNNLQRDLAALVARADLPPLTMHQLRHQAVTVMLRNGVSPVIVAAKVGHASISVTNDVYGHLVVADQASANRAIEQAIARGREHAAG